MSSSYRRLITKLQKLYAHHDILRGKEVRNNNLDISDTICQEIENILNSESYYMKKYFKY